MTELRWLEECLPLKRTSLRQAVLVENSRSTEDRRKEELLESFEGNRAAFRLGVQDGALQG